MAMIKFRMITLIFNVLLFANPVFASAMNSSIVGLHDVLNASFQKGNFVARGCGTSQANISMQQCEKLKVDVTLHTKGRCDIRRATPLEKDLYSGVVAINGPKVVGTGQLVYNDDLGVPEDGSRFVITALHVMGDNSPNKTLPAVNPISGKINPNLAKVHVRGCPKDQKVLAVCTPPAGKDLKDTNNDYLILVLEKSDCQKNAKPVLLKNIEKAEAQNCTNAHVAQVLSPGLECGTVEDRNNLTQYDAAHGPIAERDLYFGDSGVFHVNQGNDQFFYKADTAPGGSGGGIFCDNGNYRGSMLGIHRGDGSLGTNQGLLINNDITGTLKKCAEQTRQNLSAQN